MFLKNYYFLLLYIMSKIDRFSFVSIHLYIYMENCVENNGFEPLTPCVQGRCSSQLS